MVNQFLNLMKNKNAFAYCKGIFIDSFNKRILLQVNCISMLKDGTTNWNYYTDDDVHDGYIGFDNIVRFSLAFNKFPNDLINYIKISDQPSTDGSCSVIISISSGDDQGHDTELLFSVVCDNISILDSTLETVVS